MGKDPKKPERPAPDDPGWKEVEGEFDEAWLEPEAWEEFEKDDAKSS